MSIVRVIAFVVFFVTALPLLAKTTPVKVEKTDKCPVCGMFVAKYPDFLAQVVFKDGSFAHFDGAKDMFKFYLNIEKYQPTKKLSDIASLYVTDYYDMTLIETGSAWFVVGSDVFGPMGRELIPFAKEADALEFMKDHSGKQVLRFEAITPDVIKGLD